MTPREAMHIAYRHFGSDQKLAAEIGFAANAVWRARTQGKATAEMANNIEVATNGLVTREMLRPDLFSPEARLVANPWRNTRCSRRDRMRPKVKKAAFDEKKVFAP